MMHDVRMGHFSLSSCFSTAELSALRLEGDISQDYELWDEVQNWKVRSWNILHQERHPVVLTGESAVWAMGLCREPNKHTASTVTVRRIRRAFHLNVDIEERTLSSNDVWMERTYGITSPLRTTIDLLRSGSMNDQLVHELCRSVMRVHDVSLETILTTLNNMSSVPNKRMALRRAHELEN